MDPDLLEDDEIVLRGGSEDVCYRLVVLNEIEVSGGSTEREEEGERRSKERGSSP